MGITATSAAFRDDRPTLDAIVAEIERRSGLPLVVESREPGTVFRFNAAVAFACARQEQVEIYAYAPGAPNIRDTILTTEGIDQLAQDNPQVARMIDTLRTAPAPDPHLTHVHTRGYVGEEGTLHDSVAIALEALGGVLTRPMSDDRRTRAAGPFTPETLVARRRQ